MIPNLVKIDFMLSWNHLEVPMKENPTNIPIVVVVVVVFISEVSFLRIFLQLPKIVLSKIIEKIITIAGLNRLLFHVPCYHFPAQMCCHSWSNCMGFFFIPVFFHAN